MALTFLMCDGRARKQSQVINIAPEGQKGQGWTRHAGGVLRTTGPQAPDPDSLRIAGRNGEARKTNPFNGFAQIITKSRAALNGVWGLRPRRAQHASGMTGPGAEPRPFSPKFKRGP